jgi:hypothetical protein
MNESGTHPAANEPAPQEDARNDAISPKQARGLELLLEGRSDREAAAALGADPSTVWRWRQDPSFAAELEEARGDRIRSLRERVDALAPAALAILERFMTEENRSVSTRIRCATEILDRVGLTANARTRPRGAADA